MTALSDLLEALAKELEANPPEAQAERMRKILEGAEDIKVSSALPRLIKPTFGGKQGGFVSVRPVGVEYGNRSFLGIYLGDIDRSATITRTEGTISVSIGAGVVGNPCIWVPDLNQLIYGIESWWGPIESEEQLRQITNDDINNVWYVKAAKELGFEPTLHSDPTEN